MSYEMWKETEASRRKNKSICWRVDDSTKEEFSSTYEEDKEDVAKLNGYNWLFKSLDRGMCNLSGRWLFADATVRVLPRVKSDHHPLLISLSSERTPQLNWPFRFEAAWLTHASFNDFAQIQWNDALPIHIALTRLQNNLKEWNQHCLRQYFQKKEYIVGETWRYTKGIGGTSKSPLSESRGKVTNRVTWRLNSGINPLIPEIKT